MARPDFSYSYEMIDENKGMPARSGDGVLEDGERVRLVIRVRNRGDAPSETVEVNIRGDEKEELYLEAARHKLDALAPEQELEAPMAFRLIRANDEGKVSVGVTVTDREYGSFLGDNLSFDVGKPYAARQARVAPVFEFAAPPPLRTEAEQIVLEIRAKDDEEVKDFYAYLGDKKIRYERNREGQRELPLRLEVPLEEGSNRLMLAARDQRDIQATRIFLIHRLKPKGGDSLGMN
jgi:hypothetical protein